MMLAQIAQREESVLIVEDNERLARYVRRMVQGFGYRIAGVAHGRDETFAAVRRELPSLVIMDIQLSTCSEDRDGIRLGEELHARYDLPVVFLSAHIDSRTAQRVRATPSYGFVTKPFTPGSMQRAIDLAMQWRAAELAQRPRVESSQERFSRTTAKLSAAIDHSNGIPVRTYGDDDSIVTMIKDIRR